MGWNGLWLPRHNFTKREKNFTNYYDYYNMLKRIILGSSSSYFKIHSFNNINRNLSSVPKSAYLSSSDVSNRVLSTLKSMKYTPSTVNETSSFSSLEFDNSLVDEAIDLLSAEFCVSIENKTAKSITGVSEAIKYFSTHPKAR